jgi:hypothetical protein
MSGQMMSSALHVPGLSLAEKLVLVFLADKADPKGESYWGIDHMAFVLGIKSSRTVSNALHTLARKGHIEITPRPRRTSIYRLMFGVRSYADPAKNDRVTPESYPAKNDGVEVHLATIDPAKNDAIAPQNMGGESPIESPKENPPLNPRAREAARESGEVQQAFDEFWKAYPPTDGGYVSAFAAYREAVEGGAEPADILEGLAAYPFRRFVFRPDRWLREECWRVTRADVEPTLSLDELKAQLFGSPEPILQREDA